MYEFCPNVFDVCLSWPCKVCMSDAAFERRALELYCEYHSGTIRHGIRRDDTEEVSGETEVGG